MKIYIASSWANYHGVEMLTNLLRQNKFEVNSWIENNRSHPFQSFEGTNADICFGFDTTSAKNCDIFIYYAPAGMDACVELGIAYSSTNNKLILGLSNKKDNLGLMRKCVSRWTESYEDIIAFCNIFRNSIYNQSQC